MKSVISEEKRHIRFADWTTHDVSDHSFNKPIISFNINCTTTTNSFYFLKLTNLNFFFCPPQIDVLNKHLFLTSKPVIYLVNLSDKDFIRKKNKWLIKIKEWVDKNDPGASIIPFSGAFEHKLAEFEQEAERQAYVEEIKCDGILDKIITTGYKALQLEYFFTAGPDEVKAWTIQVRALFLP